MKKRIAYMLMVAAMGIALTACGDNNNNNGTTNTNTNTEATPTTTPETTPEATPETTPDDDTDTSGTSAEEMLSAILTDFEHSTFMPVEDEMVKDVYYLDPALFEDYSILMPMMNVSANEIALIKVKNESDIPAVKEGIEKRAVDAQKTFETYLQDQYEITKNYQLVTNGNYVLFVISKRADDIVQAFEDQFK